MTELTAQAVDELFRKCLFKDGENTSDAITVEGIVLRFGFHPGRIKENTDAIKNLCNQLPKEFLQTGGGGYTFLDMCRDKDGKQWTGLHSVQEQLMCLGLAIGYIAYCFERDMWSVLPGGVPYILVKDKD